MRRQNAIYDCPGDDDLERVFAHDVRHIAELSDALVRVRLPTIERWG